MFQFPYSTYKVTWITDQDESHSHYLLLSMGTDGKALIWDHVKASKELKLLHGFKFLTESIPRSLRISKAKGDVAIGGMLYIPHTLITLCRGGSFVHTALQAPVCHSRTRTRTCLLWEQRMGASSNVQCKQL